MVGMRHLIRAIFRSFFRLVLTGLFCALLAATVVFVIALNAGMRQWPPQPLTLAVLIAISVLAGYAGVVTVLLGEVLHALVKAVKFAGKEALTPGNLVEDGVRVIEHAAKK